MRDSAQMKKGLLELAVLTILQNGEEMYPLTISEELESVGLKVGDGTLYPLLTRLKNDNDVTYSWRESTAGPPRKYFAITKKGMIRREILDGEWNELTKALDLLRK